MQVEAGHVRGHIGMIMRTEDLGKLSLKSFKRKSWGIFAYTGGCAQLLHRGYRYCFPLQFQQS